MTTIIAIPPVFTCASWGDEMKLEQDRADAKLVKLSRTAWEDEKRLAKTQKRFRSWNDWLLWAQRIDDKRAASRRPNRHAPTVTPLQSLLSLRDEYVRTPGIHFATEASRVRELRKIESEICAEPGGKQALALRKCRESDEDLYDSVEHVAVTVSESDSDEELDLAKFVRNRV